MSKVSVNASNDFCPQAIFLYGTYKEDGTPNFGTFCWFSYCWDKDLHVMACIDGAKMTKDRIHAGKVFSANLVSEAMLPLADYFGTTSGYNPEKMSAAFNFMPGAVLNVPVLTDSPWSFELEVEKTFMLDEANDSELYICKIHNVLAEEALLDKSKSPEELMRIAAPALSTHFGYFSVNPIMLGKWGYGAVKVKRELPNIKEI